MRMIVVVDVEQLDDHSFVAKLTDAGDLKNPMITSKPASSQITALGDMFKQAESICTAASHTHNPRKTFNKAFNNALD